MELQNNIFRMVMNYSQASCLFFTFITKERNCCALSWIRARSFLLSSAEGRTLISWRNLSASLPINMGVFLIGLAIITRLNSNYAAKLLIYFQFTKQFPTFLRKSIITHQASIIIHHIPRPPADQFLLIAVQFLSIAVPRPRPLADQFSLINVPFA